MEKKTVFTVLFILLFPTLIILLSGDFFWPEGWIFCTWFILLCFSTILYLYRKVKKARAEISRGKAATYRSMDNFIQSLTQ